MGIQSRIRLAMKCLLGQDISPQFIQHNYILAFSEKDKLKGYNVFITGATGAIGSGICFHLASMGATIGVCGRSSEKITKTIDKITAGIEYSPTLIPVQVDVTDELSIKNGIDEFVAKTGAIDVLINNAGGQPGIVGQQAESLSEQQTEEIDLIINTNLRGTILCSKYASPYLMKQKNGLIINVGSVIGTNGKKGYCEYAAAKAGVIGFTKSHALEMAEYGVRVNCISPGLVNQTPFDCGSSVRFTEKTALKRSGYTREVAEAVEFLIFDKYITGENIIVDGGRSLGLFGD